MPEFNPFAASRLKVERAKEHIDTFDAAVQAFVNTDFYTLEIKENGRSTIEFRPEPLPDKLAVILGDAIHCARVALDFVAAQMVREKTGTSSRYVKFPFYDTKDSLLGACKGGDIKSAGPNALALVADRIRPYPGGNDLLYSLHQLDITDKHQLLIPHIAVARVVDLQLADRQNNLLVLDLAVDANGGLFSPRFPPRASNLRIIDKGRASFHVLFGAGMPMAGKPIVRTVRQFIDEVSATIDAFEAL